MNIDVLKTYITNGNIMWTTHCLKRMGERNIKRADVKSSILNGEIIEEYPKDFPFPICLVFGITAKNKCLHVVTAYDDKFLYIITTYYPSTDNFEFDFKTRRG